MDGTAKKVLVIDDTKLVRKIITYVLNSSGIETIEAENGLEGLQILEENFLNIRAITVDVEMPIMDGIEFIKNVKAKKNMKIFLLLLLRHFQKKRICKRV